jgi:hypothetical protein
MNDTSAATAPLQNIGEILIKIDAQNRLSNNGHTENISGAPDVKSLMSDKSQTRFNRIILCLLDAKQMLHSNEIAKRCGEPVYNIFAYLSKLRIVNVCVSPERGYLMIAKDFFKAYERAFGERKAGVLLDLINKANIDISEFNDDSSSTPLEHNITTTIKTDSVMINTKNATITQNNDGEEKLLQRLVNMKQERFDALSIKLKQYQTEVDSMLTDKNKLETELEALKIFVVNDTPEKEDLQATMKTEPYSL